MFARNTWYVAAWSDEVTGKPLGRRLLNEPVVLFRTATGVLAALFDRCCHRGLPLAHGRTPRAPRPTTSFPIPGTTIPAGAGRRTATT